ncbi:hemerythrin domain-containing protein [Phytohabitans kaempferiae]|uniref:Hemerythrin domain-containing protein n=1 Tax=Phytohabitans kaempferiae TaxID=1620943 RepID=A0ABV6MGQ9_9ACTN
MEAPKRKVDVVVPDRATALSIQLAQTHDALRDRIRALRRQLAAGNLSDDSAARTALLAHCVGFCDALDIHHIGEDDGLFPALRREFPELAPTVDKLAEDHWLIAGLLRRVRDLADRAAAGADATSIVGELDGLMAIMDSHFAFEERRVSAAIDALAATRDAIGADRWLAAWEA